MASSDLRYLSLIGKPGIEKIVEDIRHRRYHWGSNDKAATAAEEKRRRKMEKRKCQSQSSA